jgi:hypothetical protein
VTNLTPLLYIASSGISTGSKKIVVLVQTPSMSVRASARSRPAVVPDASTVTPHLGGLSPVS